MAIDRPNTGPQLTRLTPNPLDRVPFQPLPASAMTPKCSVCSERAPMPPHTRTEAERPICYQCWEKERAETELAAAAASILGDLDEWAARELKRMGMSSREAKAELRRVPDRLKAVLPKAPLVELMAGNPPTAGFGLGGNTDGGKTMALAAILKHHLQTWAKREVPVRGRIRPDWFRWVSWPDEVNWLRGHAIDGGPERVAELAEIRLLILDDLGRERIKGSYTDDWAASQLDTIINARFREERITLWTTNVREADLVNLYGAAMMRRLTADNPLTWVENLKSAR